MFYMQDYQCNVLLYVIGVSLWVVCVISDIIACRSLMSIHAQDFLHAQVIFTHMHMRNGKICMRVQIGSACRRCSNTYYKNHVCFRKFSTGFIFIPSEVYCATQNEWHLKMTSKGSVKFLSLVN